MSMVMNNCHLQLVGMAGAGASYGIGFATYLMHPSQCMLYFYCGDFKRGEFGFIGDQTFLIPEDEDAEYNEVELEIPVKGGLSIPTENMAGRIEHQTLYPGCTFKMQTDWIPLPKNWFL